MTTNGDRPSTSASQTRRLSEKNSTKYSFRIQSAPPLSIQHFLRSATGVIVGTQQWRHSGIYRPPPFRSYVPPTVREKKKPTEPVWHPSSAYREKPPTSLSPEKVKPKHISEPIWHPPGRYQEKPPTSLSPEKIKPKHISEPVWHLPGRYREKPPTSLSPEIVKPKHISEPVWHPAGKVKPEHVPYFDPPSLRWSLQELLRSMPEMRPQTFRASRSTSTLRKSENGQSILKKNEGQGTLRKSAEV